MFPRPSCPELFFPQLYKPSDGLGQVPADIAEFTCCIVQMPEYWTPDSGTNIAMIYPSAKIVEYPLNGVDQVAKEPTCFGEERLVVFPWPN